MAFVQTCLCQSLASVSLSALPSLPPISTSAVSIEETAEQECQRQQDRQSKVSMEELPVEVFQLIASQLGDQDLVRLMLVSHAFKNMLQERSFWHVRLLQKFDEPITLKTNVDRMRLYQARHGYLRRTVDFSNCSSTVEMIMKVVKSLIVEAEPQCSGRAGVACKNFAAMKQWLQKTNIIGDLYRRSFKGSAAQKRLLQTVLVCLAPCFLDKHINGVRPTVYRFPEAQMFAYHSVARSPIVFGASNSVVNISWLLATLQFFRHSFFNHSNLRRHYEDLLCSEKPQMWNTRLGPAFGPEQLGKVWRGTYSYLDQTELDVIRHAAPREFLFDDQNFDNSEPIQTLKLFVPDHERREGFDHLLFERDLRSLSVYTPVATPQGTRCKSHQTRRAMEDIRQASFPLEGIGWDEEDFHTTGWINPLPPQSGVPGFARMTMMKFFVEKGKLLRDVFWAYEGIVLPGGQMIIGRWWSPDSARDIASQMSGPFILWNVERAWTLEAASHVADHRGLQPGKHGLLETHGA